MSGVTLVVKVKPGRRKPVPPRRVILPDGSDAVEIAVSAPAVDGKANAALIDTLAALLEMPKRALTLTHGHTSRIKRVRVEGGEATDDRVAAWIRGLPS